MVPQQRTLASARTVLVGVPVLNDYDTRWLQSSNLIGIFDSFSLVQQEHGFDQG
jgi:hypothetical protein